MTELNEIKNNLTFDDIIKIIKHFCPNIDYINKGEYLILPTICHHLDESEASKKLYYYDNTKLFFCYTQCNGSFDIFELIKKMLSLRGLPNDFGSVLRIIESECDIGWGTPTETYQSILERYRRQGKVPQYPHYDEKVLNAFPQMIPRVWTDEGLAPQSILKYGIRINVPKEQIIIPHRDVNGGLIGIRVRNLDPEIVAAGNKYMPAKINGKYYAHPLMYNLYGLYENKKAIEKFKTAWIFEGEKSVIKCDSWFDENLAVASCGDKFNKFQLRLLLKLGVNNIVVAYDRMNFDNTSDKIYFDKLYNLCKKYKNYANFSFIFDANHILEYKAAPVDSGVDIFEKLLRERVVL